MSFRGNFWGFWGYLWGGRITMPGLRAGLEPAPTKAHTSCRGGFKTRQETAQTTKEECYVNQ